MKILILAEYRSIYGGNFIPSLEEFVMVCKERGYEVGFVFFDTVKSREWCIDLASKYPVFFIENNNLIDCAKKINRIILNNGYDCFYTHFSSKLVYAIRVINRRVSILRHVHSDIGDLELFKSKLKLFIKRTFFYNHMAHIYVSNHLRRIDKMEEKENSIYLPNALVTSRFNLENKFQLRNEIRKEYDLLEDSIVILMFGWDLKVKGVDIALLAIKNVIAKNPKIYLLIVVSSSLGETGFRDFASRLLDENEMKHLRFLPPIQNVQKYHNAADIFLSCSRSEGFSYAILEALYFGEQVISSDILGVQWAREYHNVRMFESENSEECAKEIISCISERNTLSNNIVKMNEVIAFDYDIHLWANTVCNLVEYENNRFKKS